MLTHILAYLAKEAARVAKAMADKFAARTPADLQALSVAEVTDLTTAQTDLASASASLTAALASAKAGGAPAPAPAAQPGS